MRNTRPPGSVNARNGYLPRAMPSAPPENLHSLLATMKRAAAALRDGDVDHMLGGGLAIWARGGPPSDHDVDLFVREEDADRALGVLAAAGFRTERPPEQWLYKAWDEENLVDLVFRPAGGPIGDEHFARADELEVSAHRILVASIDDVLVTKLLAITEQEPDYRVVLEIARAVREQVNWRSVAARTSESPFARAFFELVEGLAIVEPSVAMPENGKRAGDIAVADPRVP
jgi:Uncharacterised nucleotidyltransferase